MLCIESLGATEKDFEDLAVLLGQLEALGLEAGVHVRSLPEDLGRNLRFELAPFLIDGPLAANARLVLLGAHRLSDARLPGLRRLAGSGSRSSVAFGAFQSRQQVIGVTARLSYVLGQDPHIVDLGTSDGEVSHGCPIFGVVRRSAPDPKPRVLLVAPELEDRRQASALKMLHLAREFRIAVLTDRRAKEQWITAHGTGIDVYQYGEVLPAGLAEQVDVCICCVALPGFYRVQALMANLAVSGGVLVDGTADHAIAAGNDAVIRGPVDLTGLAAFLTGQILPNRGEIATQTRGSRFAAACGAGPALAALDVPEPPTAPRMQAADGPARVVFMPTNGVGLGHAQRCTLIAAELDRSRIDPVFAAFPSCTRLIKSHGFDVMPLVARSGLHAQAFANDVANYPRLRAISREAAALVFDGGYVFDSVCRTLADNRLRGVWIRRGLWQTERDNSVALDREKVFDRVIVPREAFDELNVPYSQGARVREVGPVVQQVSLAPEPRRALRERLAERYDREVGRLVLTLLGGGVATDRSAQIQALCGMMERRADVLHLVVVWPTAHLQPAWFGWSNSRIVKTQHAGALAAAADLCISAAGYNSFHEALYNRIPAIFVPQTSSFLDDQPARAAAAAERGLAGVVAPHELMKLEREIGRYLDDGEAEAVRARIATLDLPEPGNAATARLIEEMSDGYRTLERDAVADRAARRR